MTPHASPLRLAWLAFKSIKTGIFLLTLIGLACLYGTVFYAANSVLGDNAIPLAKARVFNAHWFFLLLAIFFVQFVISTWHVTVMSLTLWWKRDFTRSSGAIAASPGHAAAPVPGGVDAVMPILRRRFTRAHREGNRFFAHAGLRARLGPTIIHAGIVIVLVTGLVRVVLDRQGYILSEGRFRAAEGETSNIIFVPRFKDQAVTGGNVIPVTIPHEITVLDFQEILHPNSASPAYYSTLLEVRDPATGRVEVAKLDMNHSLRIGSYEFHQAGYEAMPLTQDWRTNFDVRDGRTGERIAVADATPGLRTQVGQQDLFLEVDGEEPGAAWRLYESRRPLQPLATGTVLQGAVTGRFSFVLTEFFPDFTFREGVGPVTLSNEPNNPAALLELRRDGSPVSRTLLFADPELAGLVPPSNPFFDLVMEDLFLREEVEDFDAFNWADAAGWRLKVALLDPTTGEQVTHRLAGLGVETEPVDVRLAAEQPATAGDFQVYALGRTTRYFTLLSVVREPMVPWYTAGVLIVAFGALLTFSGRYRAFHGIWNEQTNQLEFALVPRFGKFPDPVEFAGLIEALGGQLPPAEPDQSPTRSADDPLPAG